MSKIARRARTGSKPSQTAGKRSDGKKPAAAAVGIVNAPVVVAGSPSKFRVRVRMYRHGLGDCFLLTFPRRKKPPFQMLIDCGALDRNKNFMACVVEHIHRTVLHDSGLEDGNARLDVVACTHEHEDHLSGFNQARELFNDKFDFGSVWLAWTEDLSQDEIRKFKETKRKAIAALRGAAAGLPLDDVSALLEFSGEEDSTGKGKKSDAMDYLRLRKAKAGGCEFLKPGIPPLTLDGVGDVRVYVLGPPLDPGLYKESDVTERMKRDDVVYHLSRMGTAGLDALHAALPGVAELEAERSHPFSVEHRIVRANLKQHNPSSPTHKPYYPDIAMFVAATYDSNDEEWRRIDMEWLNAFKQLALDLDDDTNNTSLVLAFEFVKSREVLLFVGDAQVGNWKSWEKVAFDVPGRTKPMPAHELLARTVFYKVGHHCSHNATLKKGGLELMSSGDLVAFVPLDIGTAKKKGKERKDGTKGWDMPAGPLLKALESKAGGRVVISDVNEPLPSHAKDAGIYATALYVDYFLQ